MRPEALVTGANARVGRAIAVELASHGFRVGVHHRSDAAGAEETVRRCVEVGGEAWRVAADLADDGGTEALIAEVRARCPALHVLVHNASGFSPAPFAETTSAQLDAMLGVHVRAPFRITQGVLPLLRAAPSVAAGAAPGEGGLVVCIVDIGADRPVSGYAAYSVSKAALAMLVKALAVELAPAVRAVGVSPGQVAWPPDYDDGLRASLSRRIPMGRVGTPEDVARLVRFVALEAPYLNGEIIAVDGGLSKRY